jgi:hypothetical protein
VWWSKPFCAIRIFLYERNNDGHEAKLPLVFVRYLLVISSPLHDGDILSDLPGLTT